MVILYEKKIQLQQNNLAKANFFKNLYIFN